MRKFKKFATLGLACAMMIGSIVPVSAADVSVSEGDTQSAKTNISLVKENPAPTFTVGIPASATINSADATTIAFTMDEDSLNAIPDGKKVSVSIADAGYGDTTGKFALGSEDNQEATYKVYPSRYSTRPADAYDIGDLLISFYGNERVTDGTASVSRAIKADNYDEIAAGTYTGNITFSIDVRNQ